MSKQKAIIVRGKWLGDEIEVVFVERRLRMEGPGDIRRTARILFHFLFPSASFSGTRDGEGFYHGWSNHDGYSRTA